MFASTILLVYDYFFIREVILEKQLSGHRVDRSICAWYWEHAISQPDMFKVLIDYTTQMLTQNLFLVKRLILVNAHYISNFNIDVILLWFVFIWNLY